MKFGVIMSSQIMVKKAKLCFMDTCNFIQQIKTDGIYKNFAEDVKTRFDTSNYELDRPMPKGKKQKRKLD